MKHTRIHAARTALGVTAVALSLVFSGCEAGKAAGDARVRALSSLGGLGGAPLVHHHCAHHHLDRMRALVQLAGRLWALNHHYDGC
ncbi:hypothetical protein [Amycolatopsis sp. lyj-109]|uniref:hypothetical protein n=1 Tax=Amycolatopsis sp. lyj-109 TaxID=2789287 RepID=UPI00397E1CEB